MNALRMLGVGLALMGAAAWGETNEPARAEALSNLLQKIGERQAQVQTLREEARWEFVFEREGEITTNESPLHLVWERPGRLASRGNHFDMYSDGKTLTLFVEYRDRYVQWPITNVFMETLMAMDASLTNRIHSVTRSLLSGDVAGALPGEGWEVRPDEERDGRTCWVIRQVPKNDAGHGHVFTLFIDQDSGLLWQQEMEPLPAAKDDDEESGHRHLAMRYLTTSRVLNGPVEDSDFVFVPGAESKRVENTARLFGRGHKAENGLDRFELSGQPAPGFALKTLADETFELSAQSGKVVVIDFWATWCGPCVKALPHLRELHARYAASNVVFVGISRDREGQEDEVREVIQKNEITYPIVMGSHELAESYHVQGIPCLVLVGPDGTVQGRMVGFSEDGVAVVGRALDQLLAGQALASAQPLTEEEKKEAEEDRPRPVSMRSEVKWDRNVFDVVWSNATRFAGASRQREPVKVRIAARHLVMLVDSNALVLRAADGSVVHEVPLPDTARQADALERMPVCLFLEQGSDSVVVVIQVTYKEEGKGDSRSYRTVSTQLTGYGLDGSLKWTQSLGKDSHLSAVEVVPIGGSDHLLLADWDSFRILDAAGQLRVEQNIGYQTVLEVTDRDADGYPEFTAQGTTLQGAVWKRSE